LLGRAFLRIEEEEARGKKEKLGVVVLGSETVESSILR